MSERNTIARPYARAVYTLARERSATEQWSSQLQVLAEVVTQDSIAPLLTNPRISADQLATILIEAAGDSLVDGLPNLIRLLAARKRLSLLQEIATIFEALRQEQEGRVHADITVSHEIDDAHLNAIQAALARKLARQVDVSVSQDPSLIGGAIIKAGDVVIDGSMRGQLSELASALRM